MIAFLETTVDKFTLRVATDRLYAAEGVWALALGGGRVRLGVSDFVQQHGGDVTFATVQPPGTNLAPGDGFAEIDTIKVNLELPSPVGGTVAEVNGVLDATPEVVNRDPYGEGWLAVVEAADWEVDRRGLLTPEAYFALMKEEAEREAGST
jgi:glycine cleavage system H protein